MIWARMLACITGTVDQEPLLRNEYLAAENQILRAGRGRAGYYAGLVSQAGSLAFSNRSSFLTLRPRRSYQSSVGSEGPSPGALCPEYVQLRSDRISFHGTIGDA